MDLTLLYEGALIASALERAAFMRSWPYSLDSRINPRQAR